MADDSKVRHYKELLVWQKGRALVKEVYTLTGRFPVEERYGLVAQMRRCSVSVPSNIAEGQARQSTREFVQFLSHASGSLAELDTQLTLSTDLGFCTEHDASVAAGLITELQKMLASLRSKLLKFC
ncbi:MAG: four helix bundle protein [Candidatus Acidiferrales bacterium]